MRVISLQDFVYELAFREISYFDKTFGVADAVDGLMTAKKLRIPFSSLVAGPTVPIRPSSFSRAQESVTINLAIFELDFFFKSLRMEVLSTGQIEILPIDL